MALRKIAFGLLNAFIVALILSPGQSHGAGFCQEKLLLGPVPVRGKALTLRRPGFYKFEDKQYNFKFEASVSDEGELLVEAFLVNSQRHVRAQKSGQELYHEMIEQIGLDNIPVIKGLWYGGTNLEQFMEGLGAGRSPTEAVKATWSGRMAANYGFTEVRNISFDEEDFGAGKVIVGVQVDFVRPQGQQQSPKANRVLNGFKPVQGDTILDTSIANIYSFEDLDFGFYFKAELSDTGTVTISAKMLDVTRKIQSAESFHKHYQRMLQYFGAENIKATHFL